MKRLLILLVFAPLFGQVTIDIQPRSIGINENVQLSVVIENGTSSRAPTFVDGLKLGDFRLVNPRPTRSSNTSIINGVVSSTQSYIYVLAPQKQGDLVIPSQTVQYDGKKYQSRPVTIHVGPESRTLNQRGHRNQRQSQQAEVFCEMVTDKTSYYQGEPIELYIKIFKSTSVDISNRGSAMDLPDFADFWVEEKTTKQPQRRVVRNGRTYDELLVDQRRLFANKIGNLTIPAVGFTLNVAVDGGFWPDWRTIKRSSQPLDIQIKPLPEAGKPADFTGLVGSFQIDGSLDKSSVKVGESVSMTIDITGSGNFAALGDPKPPVDDAFEVFEGGAPTTQAAGGYTKKTWVFALVAKREGQFQIPLPKLTFFDLQTQTYNTLEGKTFNLEVLPGQGLGAPVQGEIDRGGGIAIEQNMAFIKLDDLGSLDQTPKLTPPLVLVKLIAGFVILDLLVFLGLFARNQSLSRRANYRPMYAHRNFKKTVAKLNPVGTDTETFYATLSTAIFDYFGDHWERPGKGISLDAIEEHFHQHDIDQGVYREVAECIEAIDLARFTPDSSDSRASLLNKARATIEKVEGVLS